MRNEESGKDLATVSHNLSVVFGEKIEEPLYPVSEMSRNTFQRLTLLVTVLANFLMWFRLLFSQRISVYMARILVPILFLDSCFGVRGDPLAAESTVARLEIGFGVLDLDIAEAGLGVRAVEDGGLWKV